VAKPICQALCLAGARHLLNQHATEALGFLGICGIAAKRKARRRFKETTPAQGLVALGSFEEAAQERRSDTASGCNASTLGFLMLYNFDHFAEIKISEQY
jgi:hypothetical protein